MRNLVTYVGGYREYRSYICFKVYCDLEKIIRKNPKQYTYFHNRQHQFTNFVVWGIEDMIIGIRRDV